MKVYTVCIVETYEKEVKLLAHNPEEAKRLADELASNDDIMLNDEYYSGRRIGITDIHQPEDLPVTELSKIRNITSQAISSK